MWRCKAHLLLPREPALRAPHAAGRVVVVVRAAAAAEEDEGVVVARGQVTAASVAMRFAWRPPAPCEVEGREGKEGVRWLLGLALQWFGFGCAAWLGTHLRRLLALRG